MEEEVQAEYHPAEDPPIEAKVQAGEEDQLALKQQGGEEPEKFKTWLPRQFTQWTPELHRWVLLGEAEREVKVESGELIAKAKLYAETLIELMQERAQLAE